MSMPDAVRVEILDLVTPGVWTDITTYVDWSGSRAPQYGRSSTYSAPQTASMSVMLVNDDGRFTPLRQTLADGTPHPYWPNLVPRALTLRYSWVIGVTPYVRFVGKIKGWPPGMKDGFIARPVITATDPGERLSRVLMKSPMLQEILDDEPEFYWPLTDAAGSTSAIEQSGNAGPKLMVIGNPVAALEFGVDGPGSGEGTAVTFHPSSAGAGQLLQNLALPKIFGTTFAIEVWVNVPAVPPAWGSGAGATQNIISVFGVQDGFFAYTFDVIIGLDNLGRPFCTGPFSALHGSVSTFGAGWRQIIVVKDSAHVNLYQDGVQVDSAAFSAFGIGAATQICLGDALAASATSVSRFSGSIGQVSITQGPPSAARVAQRSGAGHGFAGETVDERIARFLGYAGVQPADMNLDVSTVTLSSYPQAGKDVASACQDMASTEGGGSVFYFTPDGDARFTNRRDRSPAAPVLTIDGPGDLDGSGYQPAYDDAGLISEVDGTRATASESASVQVATTGSDDVATDQFTSYADTDADVLANAQERLAAQKDPAFRFGQLPIDLATATTAGIYSAVAAAVIGKRIRVTNLNALGSPSTQVDVIVEGWTDSYDGDSAGIVFDTSPADNPARMVANDVNYGAAQADGQTVTSAITAAAAAVSVTTPAGKPTFTTNAGSYPLQITIGTEVMTVTAAPGSSASPQTLPVTRGQAGTTAAPQAAGAVITLYPEVTAAL